MKWLLLLLLAACPPPPTGTRCKQHSDCRSLGEGYCARAEICTRDCEAAGCPDGYLCSPEPKRKVCIPSCESDANCFEGFVCVPSPIGKLCRLADPLKQLPK